MTTLVPTPLCVAATSLRQHLDALPRHVTAAQLRGHALRLLARQPHLMSERIEFLLSYPDALERIAQRSYWHSNGFAKIRLLQSDNFAVRLHIWPAGRNRLGDVDPHRHRWDFASWIAAGDGIRETLFEEVSLTNSDPRAVEYARYEYGRGAGASALQITGPARLRAIATLDRRAGEVYQCSRSTIHTVAPAHDGFLATVVLQGPAELQPTTVYSQHGRPARPREDPISVARLRSLLTQVQGAVIHRPARS